MADQKGGAIRISHHELKDLVAAIFAAEGMSAEDAGVLADVLVWADLRGVESHGVERVPRYLQVVKQGHMDTRAVREIRDVAPAAFVMDARKSAGQAAMLQAMDEAMRRAKSTGVALGLVSRTTHTGAIGYFAEYAARKDMVAIVMAAGMPLMAWPGSKAPSVSTSPIAIGAPGGPDGVMVFDMSTAVAASGRLRKAQLDKQPIPEGWALDPDGNPTIDPAAAAISLPIAGAKGAGLSMMIEILASLLGGAPVVARLARPGAKRGHTANGLVIAIDAARFRPVQALAADVDDLAQIIKSLPHAAGAEAARMPGERGSAEMRARLAKGIPLSARLANELAQAARERDVNLPAALTV
ncbi:MAG: Ldh family oxidoreductase [Alphaproteobacteria bacterium]|nr:Ldh family oxidoreductase [Alphaproteobacteria bacterium]